MTFFTNLFLALPSVGFILLGFFFLCWIAVVYADKQKGYNVKDIRQIVGGLIILVLAWMLLSALLSPIVFPKNKILPFELDYLELKNDDALRSQQELKNRVPKPQKRDVFVHDLAKEQLTKKEQK